MITTWELYEGYGFNLIPMSAHKIPAVKWVHFHENGGRRVEADEIKPWIEEFENFSILTGSWSGVVVVDCDSEEAYEFANSFCPPTPMEVLTSVKNPETGWRGRHLYYAHPGTWVHNKAGIYRNPDKPDKNDKIKLDIRGDGGYVLAPYSKHKSGTLYEPTCSWHPDLLAALPTFDWSWFPEHAQPGWVPPPAPGATRTSHDESLCTLTDYERGLEWIAKRDPAVQGQAGDQHTFLTARNLFEMGLSESEVLEIMLDWNRTCQPPWSENALRRKVAHAARKGTGTGKATPIFEKKQRERESRRESAPERSPRQLDPKRESKGQADPEISDSFQQNTEKQSPETPPNDGEATAKHLKPVDLDQERKKRDKRPVIILEDNLDREITQVVGAVKGLNAPPWLFERHGEIVHLVEGSEGEATRIETLTEVGLRTILSQRINFKRYIKEFKEERTRSCSKLLSEAFIHQPWLLDLPSLERVVTLPQMAADGSLCTVPGYDPVTSTYYSPLPGQEMEEIPEVVSEQDIKEAKSLLLDQMLADYRWHIDGKSWDGEPCSASLANALTIPFEPVLKSQMPEGTFTPLRLIQAPDIGSGKTFLARACIQVAQGYPASKFNPPDRYANREWNHEIVRVLQDPSETILIDNMKGNPLKHPEMDTVMTDGRYSARGMYTQKSVKAKNNKMWVATGNNAELTPDIARRTVFIGIDPLPKHVDEKDLTVGSIDKWIAKNFVRVARAVRILVRGWIQAGRPRWRELRPEVCAGKDGARANVVSYTEWGEIMGGFLDWLGVEGFYTNHTEAAAVADIAGQETAEWFAVLSKHFGENEFKVSDTIEHLEKIGTSEMYLLHSLTLSDDYRTQKRATLAKLGKWFSSHRGQVKAGVKLLGGVGKLGRSYRFSAVDRSLSEGNENDPLFRDRNKMDHGDRGRSWSGSDSMIRKKGLQMELPLGADHGDHAFVHDSRHAHVYVRAHVRTQGEGLTGKHDHHDHVFANPHETEEKSGSWYHDQSMIDHDHHDPFLEQIEQTLINTKEKVDLQKAQYSGDISETRINTEEKVDLQESEYSDEYPDDLQQNGLNTGEIVDLDHVPTIQQALIWTDEELLEIRERSLWYQIWEKYLERPTWPIERPTRSSLGFKLVTAHGTMTVPRTHTFVQQFWDRVMEQ